MSGVSLPNCVRSGPWTDDKVTLLRRLNTWIISGEVASGARKGDLLYMGMMQAIIGGKLDAVEALLGVRRFGHDILRYSVLHGCDKAIVSAIILARRYGHPDLKRFDWRDPKLHCWAEAKAKDEGNGSSM